MYVKILKTICRCKKSFLGVVKKELKKEKEGRGENFC